MSVICREHKMCKDEKCSDIYVSTIKFVLTFTNNDLTLVEIYAIVLDFCSDICQTKVEIVQVNIKSAHKM